MSSSLTDEFIDHLESIESKPLPEHVQHHAKRCLIDYLGATLAGEALIQKKTDALADSLGALEGPISVIGSSRKTDLSNAIFLNGIHSHYAELDDGVIAGIIHPGTPIFSALLPWAETKKVSGEAFLRGTVMGYESCVRLAEAIQPSHKACGYHGTATCGSIGVAWAICSMLGDSVEVKKDAFSSAAVRAGGSLKVLEDGSELKPVNSGHAALVGHTAAALAKAKFSGPNDALLGRNGFVEMMTDAHHIERLTDDADGRYCIEDTYFKPYAACRYCHPAIEAALQIQREEAIDPEAIASITVSTYEIAVAKHDHQEITGVSSAKMSIPISVAIAFVMGKAGIDEYSMSVLEREEVKVLARKVTAQVSDLYTQQFPKKSPAKLEMTLKDGRQIERIVEYPKGEPDFPLSDDELTQKFQDLAVFSGMPLERAQEISQRIWNLPADLDKIFPLLSKQQ
jgi:2-methylcitrate dehydratase PrpD